MISNPFAGFFSDPASWQIIASGEAEGHLTRAQGPDGKPALRMDYDFHGSGGFVVARKEIRFDLPETFEFLFFLRGEGLKNHFEFKIADPGGSNAWRYLKEGLQLSSDWTEFRIRERDLPFAWGPAGGGAPDSAGAIELVIAAGPGGNGNVWFSEFSLEDETLHAPETVSASSHLTQHSPESVFQAGNHQGWRAESKDPSPWWSVDFGRQIRFGGLIIHWPPAMPPRGYQIEISTNGETWTQIYEASHTLGELSHIPAHQAEARYLRMNFADAGSAALVSLQLKPDSFSHTPNEFIHAVAADYPRGWFPRYWLREQSYWTPVGSPEGRRRGLVNEEGMVEVDEAGFSLEPFLLVAGKLVTWADVDIDLSLSANGAPFPVVTWRTGDVTLTIQPWVDGTGDQLVLHTIYQIENHSEHDVRLAVTLRPYQVNPPWQAFRNLGGRSPIHHITCHAAGMDVDQRHVSWNITPESMGAAAFEEGGVVAFLAKNATPSKPTVEDKSGLASAAMLWRFPQNTHADRVTVSVPFFKEACDPTNESRENAIHDWQKILSQVEWAVPSMAVSAIECFRTAASHILINRDGPAIQPGPRRYTRSWVRDCVIMGAAMAKVGQPHVLREFLTWYVQFQHEDGYVPCVVDRDGVDDLVENDSHGQLIWGICELFRNERDLDFLKSMWQPVQRAAEYLRRLRAKRMTPEYRTTDHSDRYGLLPESASHEGYLAHPVHSYWDDFWGIRGLDAAAELAFAMGLPEESVKWRAEAADFLADVLKSIDRVIEKNQLAYIPGSVEWADFDPTATSNAIAQLDFADDLPPLPLHQMLETYLIGFRKKHRGEIPWLNYTAYEIRIIGAFVRLGKREVAHELLDVFLADRRPVEWNQWPEITWRDPRAPGHLGDVPHTWIAAEYMLALISMVASEREASEKLVLASGLPWEWISRESGFSVRGLITRYGSLDFQMDTPDAMSIRFSIGESISMPPGGLFIVPPLPAGLQILHASNSSGLPLIVNSDGTSVMVKHLPITATLVLGDSGLAGIA